MIAPLRRALPARTTGALVLGLAGAGLLTGCARSGAESGREAAAAPASTTTTTTTLPPAPADPAAPAVVLPVTDDAPNPWVLVEDGTYHLYASRSVEELAPNLPYWVSTDLRTWSPVAEALAAPAPWAAECCYWAPHVERFDDHYVLYFTAPLPTDGTKCIGTATASVPEGPFVPGSDPIVCQLDHGGSIDPRVFVDADGARWLHWKSDENSDVEGSAHSWIYAQRLADDGLGLLGEPAPILTADQPWEGRIVEAPQMVLEDGRYWLFYSGNWFNQPAYAIGVAECAGPAGPCTKLLANPFISSNAQGAGPGESSLFRDKHGWWIVYAPWAVDYEERTRRPVALARVAFDANGPYLATFEMRS